MRRILGALLALAVMGSMAGCAALFEKEYVSIAPYEAEETGPEEEPRGEAAVGSISNYAALKEAIEQLVSRHAEAAELQFQNYDGSISQDISAACWEVKSSTAIGAFAVDYISYDLSRIVSYYQADIFITYKRSADQLAALQSVKTVSALRQRLDEAIRENKTYLVLEVTVASATADTVRQGVSLAYYGDPTACPVQPSVEVGIFPESGMSRIMEVTLAYDADGEALNQKRQELAAAVDAMTAAIAPEGWTEETWPARDRVYEVCRYVWKNCALRESAGATAWDALVGGAGNSEGLAMAVEAGCQALGVSCGAVIGRLDGETHVWNQVTLDGNVYHVDASCWSAGAEQVFLAADETLWGRYWWDTSLYPAAPQTYEESQAATPSAEIGEI